MSYTVLARRYRSKDFDDLVGQEPIARTLCNAIESGRVAHAYLFCGTRGVGKTSAARILAKSLNCEKGPTCHPCGVCERCISIAAGEDIDVIEIDGASNRGIEEIRNLRANAIYRPARSPFKIYIIDEVHMLTKEAFNALLKTLEEPPSHVKFIFATTEPQKVPATISSRCQEFTFRMIPAGVIAERLKAILQAEGVDAPDAVIQRVARAGRGSMRDALSLMDQLLSVGGERINDQTVECVLGSPASEQVAALTDALADNDPAGALAQADRVLAAGHAPEQFVISLIEHLRRLMLVAVVGEKCDFLDVGEAELPKLSAQAKRFKPATLVYMIQVLEQLRQTVRTNTPASRALIDAAVVRLAMTEQFADTAELLEMLEGGGELKKKAVAAMPPPSAEAPPAGPADAVRQPAPADDDLGSALLSPDADLAAAAGEELWDRVIERMVRARMLALAGPLRLTALLRAEGSTLIVAAREEMRQMLSAPQRMGPLVETIGKLLGRAVQIKFVTSDADRAAPVRPAANGAAPTPPPAMASPSARLSQKEIDRIMNDAAVRDMMQKFNASVVGVERKS